MGDIRPCRDDEREAVLAIVKAAAGRGLRRSSPRAFIGDSKRRVHKCAEPLTPLTVHRSSFQLVTKILLIAVVTCLLAISSCGGESGGEAAVPPPSGSETFTPDDSSAADAYQELMEQQQDFEDLQEFQQQRHDSAMEQFDNYVP
jgi:hypothetical protein